MKIYLAGTTVSNPEVELKIQKLFQETHKLHSYWHCRDGFETKWYEMNKKNKVDLFLDSGAFSAVTQNAEIDLYEYIDFIKANINHITAYANLDVIGDAKATLKNQKLMEREGLMPVPTFHYGEDYRYLEIYVKKYNYIALGGLVGQPAPSLLAWLDNIFVNYICDEHGLPKIKVHGFGITSFPLMFRYPWYSLDSTSWVITGRLGSIFIPKLRGNDWDYTKPPTKISVSSKSPDIKDAGKHISNLSKGIKRDLLRFLKEMGYKLGKSEFKTVDQDYKLALNEKFIGAKPKKKGVTREVEVITEPGLCNTYQLRDEFNIQYYIEIEKHVQKWPWAFKLPRRQKRLF